MELKITHTFDLFYSDYLTHSILRSLFLSLSLFLSFATLRKKKSGE